MKDTKLDFVFGPIENYDDKLNEVKTSYEAFVLVKDEEASGNLADFVKMLPQLQKELPCDAKYRNYVPGTSSDMNVYDVVFYGGDCNAGGKTIAITCPTMTMCKPRRAPAASSSAMLCRPSLTRL